MVQRDMTHQVLWIFFILLVLQAVFFSRPKIVYSVLGLQIPCGKLMGGAPGSPVIEYFGETL